MASSSSSPKPHNTYPITNGGDDEEVYKTKAAEEKDLLELRLGRGFDLTYQNTHTCSSSSCSSSLALQQQKEKNNIITDQLGLDLGLGLGCSSSSKSSINSTHENIPCTSSYAVVSPLSICRKPHRSGLWFTLRSNSLNGEKERRLPQIPKMYIRVKDEKVTVLMVKTYLVTKLGLFNEAEIEISCRGERLESSQMLKQVRDTIWVPKLMESVVVKSGECDAAAAVSFNSNDVPVNHLIMSLDYERKCYPT